MMQILSWVAIGCSLVASAVAREIHVDNVGGDDRLDGTTTQFLIGGSGPVRSIAKALRMAQAGDHIVLADTREPYRESIVLRGARHGGSALGPLVLDGNGATLDGSATISPGAWAHEQDDVFSCRPAKLGYQQLFVDGQLAARRVMARSDSSWPRLAPLEWCFSGEKIFLRVESGRLPADYPLACCRLRAGIILDHVQNVVLRNLTIQGYQTDGIQAGDLVRDAHFEKIACRGNGRSGCSIGGASRVELIDCVLRFNGECDLLSKAWSHTSIARCDLGASLSDAIERHGEVLIDGQPIGAVEP